MTAWERYAADGGREFRDVSRRRQRERRLQAATETSVVGVRFLISADRWKAPSPASCGAGALVATSSGKFAVRQKARGMNTRNHYGRRRMVRPRYQRRSSPANESGIARASHTSTNPFDAVHEYCHAALAQYQDVALVGYRADRNARRRLRSNRLMAALPSVAHCRILVRLRVFAEHQLRISVLRISWTAAAAIAKNAD